ncbi:hypothetical protein Hanom_Chr06g00574301 [Helianthus anomalus]
MDRYNPLIIPSYPRLLFSAKILKISQENWHLKMKILSSKNLKMLDYFKYRIAR